MKSTCSRWMEEINYWVCKNLTGREVCMNSNDWMWKKILKAQTDEQQQYHWIVIYTVQLKYREQMGNEYMRKIYSKRSCMDESVILLWACNMHNRWKINRNVLKYYSWSFSTRGKKDNGNDGHVPWVNCLR